ncbi:MAG: DNA gyrase inhibitor YacG [Gammaproteobacteria bacterium]
MNKQVLCPTCNKPVSLAADNPHRPFCSERCRLVDLGEWVQEGYSIPDKDSAPSSIPEEEQDYFSRH